MIIIIKYSTSKDRRLSGSSTRFHFNLNANMLIWQINFSLDNTLQTLFVKGRRIPEPFCLVDMGVQSGDLIEVKIAEGAVIGLDEVRKQVAKEIAEEQG